MKTQNRTEEVLSSILTAQLFPAKDWRVTATTREAEQVVVDLKPTRTSAICSDCGETKLWLQDVKPTRIWRHTNCWNVSTLEVARRGITEMRNERPQLHPRVILE